MSETKSIAIRERKKNKEMATTPTPENLQYQLTHKDEDRGPLIKTVSIVLIVIATVLVILRFLARWIRRLKLQIDDYFMIPALVRSSPTPVFFEATLTWMEKLFTIVLCVENIICKLSPCSLYTLMIWADDFVAVRFGNGKHTVAVGLENSEKLIEVRSYVLSLSMRITNRPAANLLPLRYVRRCPFLRENVRNLSLLPTRVNDYSNKIHLYHLEQR